MNTQKNDNIQRGIALTLITLLCAACGSNSTPTPVPTAAAPVSSAATAAPAPELPTAVPIAEPTVEAPKSVPGVNLTLDPGLGKSVSAQIMPAVPKTEGPAFGDAAPEHVMITFDGEPASNDDFRLRRVAIYPVDGLRAIDPVIGKEIDQLKQILQRKPKTIRTEVPFLPVIPAQQLVHTNLEYVKFANGEGIRFITAYAQDTMPLTNDQIIYAFQGLTSDGKYLISAAYPVAAEGLPKTFDETPAAKNNAEFAKGYERYLAETTAQLNKLTPQQFTPDLSKLDGMFASLQAEPQLDTAAADPSQGTEVKATPKAGAEAKATPVPAAGVVTDTEAAGATQDAIGVIRRLVNLRAAPSTRAKILENLNRNSKVQLLGRDKRGAWIQVKIANGTEGWVNRSFISTRFNVRTLAVVP